MGDSQEYTIENFNSEHTGTNFESSWVGGVTELINKAILIPKDISVPTKSHNSEESWLLDSVVKYKEPTPREYNITPEVMITPEKISARMTKIFIQNPLDNWRPVQLVASPESIQTPIQESSMKQGNEVGEIYLYDLKENTNKINQESLCELLDLQGKTIQ